MAWITPITDWDGVTESPNRKYYNFGDLNRVENNTQEVANIIGSYGTAPVLLSVKTDRDNTRIEFYDELNRIENNIIALKNASHEPPGWITPRTDWESLQQHDYRDANRVESNLLALYLLVNAIIDGFMICGDFTCGQNTML